jgi:hypothetical protein
MGVPAVRKWSFRQEPVIIHWHSIFEGNFLISDPPCTSPEKWPSLGEIVDGGFAATGNVRFRAKVSRNSAAGL